MGVRAFSSWRSRVQGIRAQPWVQGVPSSGLELADGAINGSLGVQGYGVSDLSGGERGFGAFRIPQLEFLREGD